MPSVVETDEHGMPKHFNGIGKVDTMLPDILTVLLFIPFELHGGIVYTFSSYVNCLIKNVTNADY
jgi:hypothetical protein